MLMTTPRGFIGGITRGSTSAHIARACVEGIAHSCIDLIDAVGLADDEQIRVDGGLAQSTLLLQTIADLGQRPVLRSQQVETTAHGAALLAGLAVGTYASAADAGHAVKSDTPFLPCDDSPTAKRDAWQDLVLRTVS